MKKEIYSVILSRDDNNGYYLIPESLKEKFYALNEVLYNLYHNFNQLNEEYGELNPEHIPFSELKLIQNKISSVESKIDYREKEFSELFDKYYYENIYNIKFKGEYVNE